MGIKHIGLIKKEEGITGINEYIFEEEVEDIFDKEAIKKQIREKLQGEEEIHLHVKYLSIITYQVVEYAQETNKKIIIYYYRDEGEKVRVEHVTQKRYKVRTT